MVLDEAEFRRVQALVGGRLVRAPNDAGQTAFQGLQVTAALPQAFEIPTEFRFLGREEFEAAADGGVRFGELPLGQQRLAESPVGTKPPRFEPDGLPEVVDRLVESGAVRRGDAEAVPGRDPFGVEFIGLPVVIYGLAQGRTAELVKGLDTRRVVLEHLVAPALGQQGDPEVVVGEGEIRIDPQGLPVMADRLVDPTTAGIDFAEVEMRGGQLRIGPQGVPVLVNREPPEALAFHAQAEVVAGRREVGVDAQGPPEDGNRPGAPAAVGVVFQPAHVDQDEAEVVMDGDRLRPKVQRLPVVGGCRCPIALALPDRAVQGTGQGKVGPEVVGVLFLDAPQEPDPVPAGEL